MKASEYRSILTPPAITNEGKTLTGYAVRYNNLSHDLGGFREKVAAGAFGDVSTLDVRAFHEHNSGAILGRTTAGTLRLKSDETGLAFEIDLGTRSYDNDLRESIQRGDITGMSFGFRVLPGGDVIESGTDGEVIRTVTKAELVEISPVSIPAYPDTSVAMRSIKTAATHGKVMYSQYLRILQSLETM